MKQIFSDQKSKHVVHSTTADCDSNLSGQIISRAYTYAMAVWLKQDNQHIKTNWTKMIKYVHQSVHILIRLENCPQLSILTRGQFSGRQKQKNDLLATSVIKKTVPHGVLKNPSETFHLKALPSSHIRWQQWKGLRQEYEWCAKIIDALLRSSL